MKQRVSFGAGSSGGITVYVDRRMAPHARPYERGSEGQGGSSFRHPVFGTDTWVAQKTRPFFMPAVRQAQPTVVREVQAAIDQALGRL